MQLVLRPPRYWGGDQVMLASIETSVACSVKLATFTVGLPGELLHPAIVYRS